MFDSFPETAEPLVKGFSMALTLWFGSAGFWWVWWSFKSWTR